MRTLGLFLALFVEVADEVVNSFEILMHLRLILRLLRFVLLSNCSTRALDQIRVNMHCLVFVYQVVLSVVVHYLLDVMETVFDFLFVKGLCEIRV